MVSYAVRIGVSMFGVAGISVSSICVLDIGVDCIHVFRVDVVVILQSVLMWLGLGCTMASLLWCEACVEV